MGGGIVPSVISPPVFTIFAIIIFAAQIVVVIHLIEHRAQNGAAALLDLLLDIQQFLTAHIVVAVSLSRNYFQTPMPIPEPFCRHRIIFSVWNTVKHSVDRTVRFGRLR